jgi:ABC-type spermidine/putrescine transport system permease subunit II
MLYEGTKNQVLAILMWNMWEQGQLPAVAAIGTVMTIFLLSVSICLRVFGFGKATDKG